MRGNTRQAVGLALALVAMIVLFYGAWAIWLA
jgi:hypothetical protein